MYSDIDASKKISLDIQVNSAKTEKKNCTPHPPRSKRIQARS